MDDFQEWKNKWNRYLIVFLVVFMFLGATVSLAEALGSVFSGAFFGAVFAVIIWFLLKEFNDPRIAYEEIWRQFCSEIGAELVIEKSFPRKRCKAVAKTKDWTITFDVYALISSDAFTTCTLIRAPFVSKDGFWFKIYQSGLFSKIKRLLGMQDIEVGYPSLDLNFTIKGNDKSKVRELFADTRIRQFIQAQPSIVFGIRTSSSIGMVELYFGQHENNMHIIEHIKRLKPLYELFTETLNKLHHIGSA